MYIIKRPITGTHMLLPAWPYTQPRRRSGRGALNEVARAKHFGAFGPTGKPVCALMFAVVVLMLKLTNKQTNKQTNNQTNKQSDKHTNKQTNKQTNQTNKQANRQSNKHTHNTKTRRLAPATPLEA